MLCDYHANLRANPDAKMRDLGRAARMGDVAAAEELYAYWVRTETVPTIPPKMEYSVPYNGRKCRLILFDQDQFRLGYDFLHKKPLQAMAHLPIRVPLTQPEHYLFKLIDGKLEAKHILNEKNRVIESKLDRYSPLLRGFFLAVRQWSVEHPAEIAAAQRAWTIYRLRLSHHQYQKAFEELQKHQKDVAASVIHFLQYS